MLFLESAAKLFKDRGGIRVILVGNGPEESKLKDFVKKQGLEAKVHFAGYVANPAPYYQAFDVFVLSSITEGIPLSILEAMASHVPVVSTRVGGIPKVIEHGKTGILVDSNDAQALSLQLKLLSQDKKQREALAAAALEYVQNHFSVEKMHQSYNSVYHEVTS